MSDESTFRIIGFDANLLGSYYGAQQQAASLRTLPAVPSNVSLGTQNGVLTPWDKDNAAEQERLSENSSSSSLYRLLTKDFNSIQNKDDFFDGKGLNLRDDDLSADGKSLFNLYSALKNLKTIAEYAGDPRTSASKMGDLNELFQLGMSQVKDFIKTEKFDALTLLYGDKLDNVKSAVGLGKTEYDYVGPVFHTGKKSDPVTSLDGTESFTITITKSTTTSGIKKVVEESFVIDIPDAEENRTLENIIGQINAKIQTIKTTDDEGEEIPLFNTRFFAEEVSKDKFALRVKTDFSEKLNFSSPDTEPAIYITGNNQSIDSTTKLANSEYPGTSFITKLTDLDNITASSEIQKTIFANESDPLLKPESTADTKPINPLANAAATSASAIATDSKGYVYSIGATEGRFANHLNTSENGDAYLNKYDASGKLVWSRLIGSAGEANAYAITIDNEDNVIIAGQADKLSAGNNVFSGKDSFIAKYNNVGTQQWIYQNDKYGTDAALSVTTDSNGDVYITGKQNSVELSSTILSGNDNAYVLKLDGNNGTAADYVEIGSSTADLGQAITVASDGNIVVATHEDGHLILQKLDKDDLSSELWSYDYGSLGSGSKINNVVVEGDRIYVSGSSRNSLSGAGAEIVGPQGGLDSFVLAIDDQGNSASADWTKFIGTSENDTTGGIAVSAGKIYLSGTTGAGINGGTAQGGTDGFAVKIDASSGATDWAKQLGLATESRTATGIAFSTLGTSVLTKIGLPIGEFEDDEKRNIETQTTAQAGDYFYIKVNNFTTHKIEIKEGDTFRTLANRINRVSFRYIKATVTFSTGTTSTVDKNEDKEFDAKAVIAEKLKQIQNERNGVTETEKFARANLTTYGNSLKISSIDGGRIQIMAGRGDQDALKKLGIDPTVILSSEELFNLDKDAPKKEKKIGGIFAFKLDDRFNVEDKRDARYVAQELEAAIGIVQSAYRSLTYDPLAEKIKEDALKKQGGEVPSYLLKQLNNYQDGLNRISTIVPQNGGFLI